VTSPAVYPYRAVRRIAAFAIAVGPLCWWAFAQHKQNADTHTKPVLVELFTSEGCSDCPPADAELAQLDKQVVPGAQVIVLSEHVTYWNHLGWRDPFSFDEIDRRQENYVSEFRLDFPATPEFVVDGAMQVAGNNPPVLANYITRAAAASKIPVNIDNVHREADGSVAFTVHAPTAVDASLVAVIAENATHSTVSRGENAGRTLHHIAVVRVIKDFGSGTFDGRAFQLSGPGLLSAEKDGQSLRLIVFLVGRKNLEVVGAAEQILNP